MSDVFIQRYILHPAKSFLTTKGSKHQHPECLKICTLKKRYTSQFQMTHRNVCFARDPQVRSNGHAEMFSLQNSPQIDKFV